MLIVDTGFLFALIYQKDAHHEKALRFAHSHEEGWLTTWPVLTETLYLLTERLHIDAAIDLLHDVVNGTIQIWDIPMEKVAEAEKLMRQYKSLPMDLADASLVLLAEHLGHGRILTTDQRDFGAYRWKSRRPFEDVMSQH